MQQIFRPDRPAVLRRHHPLARHPPRPIRFTQATDETRNFRSTAVRASSTSAASASRATGDPRASFAVVSDGVVEIHRVPYDSGRRSEDPRRRLHPALADRWRGASDRMGPVVLVLCTVPEPRRCRWSMRCWSERLICLRQPARPLRSRYRWQGAIQTAPRRCCC